MSRPSTSSTTGALLARTSTPRLSSWPSTTARLNSPCGESGVTIIARVCGETIGPPAAKL